MDRERFAFERERDLDDLIRTVFRLVAGYRAVGRSSLALGPEERRLPRRWAEIVWH
jgi:hypothetical protein